MMRDGWMAGGNAKKPLNNRWRCHGWKCFVAVAVRSMASPTLVAFPRIFTTHVIPSRYDTEMRNTELKHSKAGSRNWKKLYESESEFDIALHGAISENVPKTCHHDIPSHYEYYSRGTQTMGSNKAKGLR